MKTWLWPNRTISKTESAQLREEHNAAVNTAHDLLTALRSLARRFPEPNQDSLASEALDNARRAIDAATK